jgi:UDP-N-acetylglucosamine 2-epimerase (non-hydrolysing)
MDAATAGNNDLIRHSLGELIPTFSGCPGNSTNRKARQAGPKHRLKRNNVHPGKTGETVNQPQVNHTIPTMLIDIIAGARPNFMKIAPIIEQMEKAAEQGADIEYRLIHTGQHYDKKMSGDFFEQLGIPEPHINLEVGSGTQAEQTAGIMVRYEKVLTERKPDVCLVVGDVTSTMACSIVAKKTGVDVVHVEAGIRSHDLTMPEEINRMVTDALTDHFFTTSEVANQNLRKAGVPEERIHFVGNTMIDTLLKQMPRFTRPALWDRIGLQEKNYIVMTLHRPANVDEEQKLRDLLNAIIGNSRGVPLVFPVHPRTRKILDHLGIQAPNLHLAEPMGYLEFNYLVKHAKAVITDSGGITEETTVMQVPCMTLRDNTERPETITTGTNELVGTDPASIPAHMDRLFDGQWKKGGIPELWDGKTDPEGS